MRRRATYCRADLVHIGVEGFGMVDEEYGHNNNTPRQQQLTHSQERRQFNELTATASSVAPTRTFQKQYPISWWRYMIPLKKDRDVMDCDQAAKVYGGVVVKKVTLFRNGY